jgi:hypothetical protein
VAILDLAVPIVQKLLAEGTIPKGAIDVVGALPGSTIIVDGEVKGSTDLPKITDVLVGAHHVVVQKEGMPNAEAWVIVEKDKAKSVPVSQAVDEPFYSTWWFWTATGAGVVVAGGTAAAVALLLGGGGGKTGVNVSLNADEALGGTR